ncbi:MAG: minor capsid protein [Ruminiclostridium sp.]|nr:minor capsid protein [Ruminiclostridium sp.]
MTQKQLQKRLEAEYDRIIAETLAELKRKKPLTKKKLAEALMEANKRYWVIRIALTDKDTVDSAETFARTLAYPYANAAKTFSDRVRNIYSNYESAFSLTHKDAKELLDKVVYDRSIAENLKAIAEDMPDGEEKARILAEISAPAYRYRVQRAEALSRQAKETCDAIAKREVKTERAFLQTQTEKAYNITADEILGKSPAEAVLDEVIPEPIQLRFNEMPKASEPVQEFTPTATTGVHDSFSLVNTKAVNEITKTDWSGNHFSERVWNNTDKLAAEVKKTLIEGELTGASEADMAAKIAEHFEVGMHAARRVVRTESNYCINQAELKGMKDAGYDEYEFISLGENAENVCDICDALDGQKFKVKDAAVGVNMPPMHPFCRCKVTTPEESLEDIEREIDERIKSWNIPEGMSLDEFIDRVNNGELEQIRAEQEKSVQKTVDNSENRGIMKVEKEETTENGMLILSSKFMNPNDDLYRYADRITPEEGFGDIICHGDPDNLLIRGMSGEEWEYPAEEAADMIRNSREFKGEPIRLIACQTGAKENGIAQKLADTLGVEVKAPTESVYINMRGEMFITDNDILARLWDKGEDVEETGEWKIFTPRKR